jgi:hypothetical protein
VVAVVTTRALAEPVEQPHRALAEPAAGSPTEAPDRFTLLGRSETFVQLFRRALLPGSAGAAVTRETSAPITDYLRATARDVDAPWQRDALDLELSAWGQVWPTSTSFERPFDGDLQTANIGLRVGWLGLRAGRQQLTGGAARFVRFDGLRLSVSLPAQLLLEAYEGWTVLPRWDRRPGYQQLGLKERELSEDEQLTLARSGQRLLGGRLGYAGRALRATASVHEQREQDRVARRNLGLDAGATLGKLASVGVSALYSLDARHFADARAWLDWQVLEGLDATLEALRAKPGLLLSRQSVLSVFGSSAYDEAGGALSWEALTFLRLEASGYLEAYDAGRPGARSDAAARFELGGARRTVVRVGYGRVIIGEDGYQSLRASLARSLTEHLAGTLDLYGYFYDRPILGYRTSSVYSGTFSYQVLEPLSLLWGASVFRSPYAALDAQTMLRVSYDVDFGSGSGRRPR